MSLPLIIYLKDYVVASWAINDGTTYRIEMDFANANDDGQTPVGQGFFYCTDASVTNPNDHSISNMGWLQTAGVVLENPLNGYKLNAFLLLPLLDDFNGTLQIGPKLGQKQGKNYPDAAELSYSFQKPGGILPIISQADNDNATKVNTFNVEVAMRDKKNVLFREFTPSDGNGVLLTPQKSKPNFEKNVNIHLVDGQGNIKGILDKKSAGTSYWVPIDSSNLYLVATLAREVKSNTVQVFNVGDPRTNGTISVDETADDILGKFIFWLKLKIRNLLR